IFTSGLNWIKSTTNSNIYYVRVPASGNFTVNIKAGVNYGDMFASETYPNLDGTGICNPYQGNYFQTPAAGATATNWYGFSTCYNMQHGPQCAAWVANYGRVYAAFNPTWGGSTVTYASGGQSQTICPGYAMSTITWNIATGVDVLAVTGLPAGISYSFNPNGSGGGTVTISGTPTVQTSGAYTYNIVSGGTSPSTSLGSGTLTVDNTAPTLASPGNQTLTAGGSCTAAYTISDPVTDNCSGAKWGYSTTGVTTLTSTGNSINDGTNSSSLTFNKGVTTVTLTGVDGEGNNASNASFTVTVSDATAPVVTSCPASSSGVTSAGACTAAVPNYAASTTATDNCTTLGTITQSPLAGALVGLGATTVTVSVPDVVPNTNTTCKPVFTVTDNQVPTLNNPGNLTFSADASCQYTYTIADPISDNCTGAKWGYSTTGVTTLSSTGNTINDGTTSGALVFNKGVTTATNATFTITVNDNTIPAVTTCPANQSANTISGFCTAPVPNFLSTLTASDNCTASGSLTISQSPTAGTQASTGVNTIVITVTDAAGNSNTTCRPTFTVTDNQSPVLTANSNQTLNTAAGVCTQTYTITDPIADNCGSLWGFTSSGATTTLTSSGNTIADGSNSSVLTFNKGVTTITLTGTDGTNAAVTKTFTVTVSDGELPVLTANSNQTLTTATGVCTQTYTITDPIADNCTGSLWGFTSSGATTTLTSSGNTIADG
ncbi:MAG: hypothetical protein NTZ16_16500, partial [Verrucomicrobia bacterium]|nr:hypothetical protein [Verrucomicrobiota bacterium]